MKPSRSRADLLPIVILLLVQFALRAHHPLAMAAFWDENSHITRAHDLYHLTGSPVAASHGKLLLYFWLGLFQPDPAQGALAVSRLAIALFSLVGSAGIVAAARALFGRWAMVPALAFYALAPYAVFFERMAFADPFAGALAALVAWQSVVLARRPTRARGALVGLLIALTGLAKLTTAIVGGLPLLAILLFGGEPWRDWRALWRRYRPALAAGAVALAAPWIVVLGIALVQVVGQGQEIILLDTYLIGDNTRAGGVFARLENTLILKTGLLLGHPMTLLLAGLAAALLWKRTRPALYVLAWLGAIWLPITLVATELQSRYLMAGVPALAVIFGGGMATAGTWIAGRAGRSRLAAPLTRTLAGAALAAWALLFALPFVRTATTDPGRLEMPRQDVTNYFSGLFTTWGTRAAFDDLQASGQRAGGMVPVVGVLRVCEVHTLFLPDDIAWDCMPSHAFPDQIVPRDTATWTVLHTSVARWPFVYLLTDYLPPDAAPQGSPDLAWEFAGSYPRPHDGTPVTVWRVTVRRS